MIPKSGMMGRDDFIWWLGVVESRKDPLMLGRCKVRILGWHTKDKGRMPTASLPWATPLQPTTSAAQTQVGHTPLGLVEGSWVLGFFQDGDEAQTKERTTCNHGINGNGLDQRRSIRTRSSRISRFVPSRSNQCRCTL